MGVSPEAIEPQNREGDRMSFITNVDKFSVGNPMVDADHRMLAEYINLLHEAVCSSALISEQVHLFAQLIERTKEHFQREEVLMQNMVYPDYAKHKAEHDMLLEEVQDLLVRFNVGSISLTDNLFSYLEEWLTFHEVTSDKKLAETIRQAEEK